MSYLFLSISLFSNISLLIFTFDGRKSQYQTYWQKIKKIRFKVNISKIAYWLLDFNDSRKVKYVLWPNAITFLSIKCKKTTKRKKIFTGRWKIIPSWG